MCPGLATNRRNNLTLGPRTFRHTRAMIRVENFALIVVEHDVAVARDEADVCAPFVAPKLRRGAVETPEFRIVHVNAEPARRAERSRGFAPVFRVDLRTGRDLAAGRRHRHETITPPGVEQIHDRHRVTWIGGGF